MKSLALFLALWTVLSLVFLAFAPPARRERRLPVPMILLSENFGSTNGLERCSLKRFCDERPVGDELVKVKIVLKDSKEGTTWEIKS